ncbi:MAG: DNA polymerase II large subunit [Candidatus Thorarchaeota archaeon]
MVEMSDKMENYFSVIQNQVDECYKIAEKARKKGLDPEMFVECPQARDLAGRVEKLVGPEGVAEIIRELKAKGKSDDEIVFQVVTDILDQKVGKIQLLEERVERAIRVGLAIKTMGVVSAPLEGISKILIRKDKQGNRYLSLFFAGPIRAAGGTTAALSVLIADYVREKTNIPKYEATEAEVGRYVEEIKLYDRRVHLQYPSSNDEIRFAVKHLPVEINGDSTEEEEISAFRNLPRISTNKIRGGACLVLNDGILLKALKLLKIANAMNLKGWDWLGDLKKIGSKREIKNKAKKKEIDKFDVKVPPNSKFVADIIAGRPVFSHPSKVGGHRIRYGRCRNTGLAAAGIHPATMGILDNFISIGTQLRTERPGKSASICPVSSIEPPIVKLKNGNVVKVRSYNSAIHIFPEVEKVLFLGDILFSFGEFAENNHILVPSGYVEEWWALDLEKAIKSSVKIDQKIKDYANNPFNSKPSAEEAIKLSLTYHVPLHPSYTDFWGNITIEELYTLRKAMLSGFSEKEEKIILENRGQVKNVLEKAFILHKVKDNQIFFNNAMNYVYKVLFNLREKEVIEPSKEENVFNYFYRLCSIELKNKAPYYMGTRMGRPEKSERKTMKGIHTLFPLSDKVGNSRLVEKAMALKKIKIDVCRRLCPNCNSISIFNVCPNCHSHTDLKSICLKCKSLYSASDPQEKRLCPKCNDELRSSSEALFDIKSYLDSVLNSLQIPFPRKIKGIFGLTNTFKVPEPIEKGILRAKNDVLVYKTAEIRYDATDIPLTHFKAKEVGVSIEKLKSLGYNLDFKGDSLINEEQIIELKVQDVIISDDCAKYLIKVSTFLDDELEFFYKMDRFYNISEKKELIGHLIVGLAPHTSAGVIGRIVGFTPARAIYAHPYWHAAKRRNCDGDEDGIMLLVDPLLNFSRYYLPSKIGGRMDATLVIGTLLDPNEVDVEAHNIDTLYKYPLEFYEATEKYNSPSEIENSMELVKSRLGSPEQYENIGFNIPTENINEGPTMTAYKTYESMDSKIDAQLYLAKIIKAVNAKKVAKKILMSHFNPDILGNLRKFSVQEFRCVKCNEKFRRPPLSNSGNCTKCGNRVILTVNRGGIEKYIPRANKLCKNFKLDKYTVQRMELIEDYVESLTNNPRIKQQKLSDFF